MRRPLAQRAAVALAALALGGALAGAAPSPPSKPARHVVTIDATSYTPRLLVVQRGDTVLFVNDDVFRHTATSKAAGFDSKDIESGASWTVTLTRAGRFDYACVYHSTMTGTLIVK